MVSDAPELVALAKRIGAYAPMHWGSIHASASTEVEDKELLLSLEGSAR